MTMTLKDLTLRQKIGQMYLQYFKGYEDMPESIKTQNLKGEVGGFIFFSGNNVRDLDQLRTMIGTLQRQSALSPHKIPFMMSIDQEGGQLSAIFRGNTLFPGNMSLGLTRDPGLAYRQGSHVGKELKYAGIDLCFAPVLDVDYDVCHGVPIVDNRKYSHEPEVVASMGAGYIEGLNDEKIIACGKHFPGMRITEVDTHFAVDRSPYDMERLESVEILPFKKAIEVGLTSIMTHHGIFEAMDPTWPASLSPKVHQYLREILNYKGLVVTDDLIMQAILHEYGQEEPIKQAILAGADLIIHTYASDWFVDYVEKQVLIGEIPEARIDEAVERILEHKQSFGVGTMSQSKTYDDSEGMALAKEIAAKGTVLYKGSPEEFPLKGYENRKLGIVFGNPARLVMSDATNLYDLDFAGWARQMQVFSVVKEAIMPWQPTKEEIISLTDIGYISDVILFTTVNAYRFEGQIEVLKAIREACPDKTLIAVASRSPQDAPYLAEYSDYVVITGGITEGTMKGMLDNLFVTGDFVTHPPISYLSRNEG